jgi:hypothetical protein
MILNDKTMAIDRTPEPPERSEAINEIMFTDGVVLCGQ